MSKASGWILIGFAMLALASVAASQVNLNQALAEQRTLTSENPADPAAWNDLGNLLVRAGQPEEAEAAYRRALEQEPETVAARFNLALLLQQRGAPRDALRQFRRVIDLAPQHAWAHYQIGVLMESQGARGAAIRAYATAFRLDPQLAFDNVNPQIVDNGLLVEALLEAFGESSPATEAPRLYSDPNRIYRLLVASPPSEQPSPAEPPAHPAPPPDTSLEPASPEEPPAEGVFIDPDSLEDRGALRQGTRSEATQDDRSLRTHLASPAPPADRGRSGALRRGPSEDRAAQPPPRRRLAAPQSAYRPSLLSTGRLELRLGTKELSQVALAG